MASVANVHRKSEEMLSGNYGQNRVKNQSIQNYNRVQNQGIQNLTKEQYNQLLYLLENFQV